MNINFIGAFWAKFRVAASLKHLREVLFIAVALVIMVLLSIVLINRVEDTIRGSSGVALETVLSTTIESLHNWINLRKNDIEIIASNPELQILAEDILKLPFDGDILDSSIELKRIREFFIPILPRFNDLGIFIISINGDNYASMRRANLGEKNLVAQNRESLFQDVLNGQIRIIPPIVSDVLLEGHVRNQTSRTPTMFVMSPIRNDKDKIIAILAIRINFYLEFSTILSLGRIGDSGETYSFDEEGRMLSASRFYNQMTSNDKLESVLGDLMFSRITDPGGNILEGFEPDVPKEMQELTYMAQQATLGYSGTNIEGYSDYRGITVLGTWLWDDEIGMGMTVEIDKEEALLAYYQVKITILIGLAGTILIVIFLSFILIRSRLISEKHIVESQQRFTLAMEATSDGLFDWNSQLNQGYFNDNYWNMLGYKKGDFPENIQSAVLRLLHPGDVHKLTQVFKEVSKTDIDKFELEYRMKMISGDYKWILGRGKVLKRDEKGRLIRIIGTHIDLSQRKQMETKLIESKLKAETANKAKSEFLANTSHEIRTPLNAIINFTDLLSHKITDKTQLNYLESIRSSGQNLLVLLNDILDLATSEVGTMEISPQYIEAAQIWKDLIDSYFPEAEKKGLELRFTIDDKIPDLILMDAEHLKQLLGYLLDNACKFTDNGRIGFTVKGHNYSRKKRTGEMLFDIDVAVSDTGQGISEEDMASVFSPFNQADGQSSRQFEGLGIGLTIAQHLSSLMNGCIVPESTLGKGSTFTLHLSRVSGKDIDESIEPLTKVTVSPLIEPTHTKPSEAIETVSCSPEDLITVIATISDILMPQWKSFQDQQPMEEIALFAKDITELGNKYSIYIISDYGIQLLDSIENFDIDKMLNQLSYFPSLLTKLKNG